jgi:hypothetical protein
MAAGHQVVPKESSQDKVLTPFFRMTWVPVVRTGHVWAEFKDIKVEIVLSYIKLAWSPAPAAYFHFRLYQTRSSIQNKSPTQND